MIATRRGRRVCEAWCRHRQHRRGHRCHDLFGTPARPRRSDPSDPEKCLRFICEVFLALLVGATTPLATVLARDSTGRYRTCPSWRPSPNGIEDERFPGFLGGPAKSVVPAEPNQLKAVRAGVGGAFVAAMPTLYLLQERLVVGHARENHFSFTPTGTRSSCPAD